MIDMLLNFLWLACLVLSFVSGWNLGKASVYREWREQLRKGRDD
jgi:hypothetical protein